MLVPARRRSPPLWPSVAALPTLTVSTGNVNFEPLALAGATAEVVMPWTPSAAVCSVRTDVPLPAGVAALAPAGSAIAPTMQQQRTLRPIMNNNSWLGQWKQLGR